MGNSLDSGNATDALSEDRGSICCCKRKGVYIYYADKGAGFGGGAPKDRVSIQMLHRGSEAQ